MSIKGFYAQKEEKKRGKGRKSGWMQVMNVLGYQGKKVGWRKKGERRNRESSREQSRREEERGRIKIKK